MKQITLYWQPVAVREGRCFAKFVMAWVLYGYLMLMVWQWTYREPLGPALAWTVGILLGLWLAVAMRGE